jgi:hypothetical protein
MPEVIFHGNGTDEAFHMRIDPLHSYIERWAKLQVL